MQEYMLITGGILKAALAIFHLSFWRNPEFNWQAELPRMNMLNRAIMQVSTLMFVYVLLGFAAISFLLRSSQALGSVEKMMIVLMGGFYLVRAAVQFPFFGVSRISAGLFGVCLLGAGCYSKKSNHTPVNCSTAGRP